MRSDGNICYAAVVMAVTFKILFDSNSINALVLLAAKVSTWAYFLFVFVMGQFVHLDIFN